MKPERGKTSWLIGGMWVAVASLFDLITAILDLIFIGIVLSPILDGLYILSLGLFFLLGGQLTWRRKVILVSAFVGKAIPFLGALPFLTGITAYLFFNIIKEERLPSILSKII